MRTGYTFTGWDKGFTNVNEDLTITAQYEINKYTVSFMADGKLVSSIEKEYGQVLSDADYPAVPAKEGYTGAWKRSIDPITADLTIEAEYTKIPDLVPDEGNGGNKPSGDKQDEGIAGVVNDVLTGNYASVLPYAAVLVVAVVAAGVVIVMKKKKEKQ